MESNFAFCGVRTHAYYRIVDLKSTPLDHSGKNAYNCSITGSNRGPLAHKTNALTNWAKGADINLQALNIIHKSVIVQ